ncbi:hypothetical protein [Streptomyces sp. NPDC053431]|uniref:hypothetical protein n=1 Tax=Streptomyces sp. NPDC053431 TaxID=3365703 RepID=UPI0037D3815D
MNGTPTRIPGRRARGALLASPAALAALLLAGCAAPPSAASGSEAPPATAAPKAPHVPPAARTADPDPALTLTLTRREQERLHQAEQRLVARCMSDHGFEYAVTPLGRTDDTPWAAPYGSDDEARAREEGYGLAALRTREAADRRTEEQARRTDPNNRYATSLTPERRQAYDTALFGTRRNAITVRLPRLGTLFTSADGCLSEARGTLYGDLADWTRAKAVVSHLRTLTAPERERDPRWTRALDAWRTCMRTAGFPYRTPDQARLALRDKDGATERRTAVADARCNRTTALARTGTRTEEDHVRAAATGPYRAETAYYTRAVRQALAGPAGGPDA